MTDQNFRQIISDGWLDKAEQAHEEATILLQAGKPIGCVNRLYYAVFYAVSAACAKEGRTYGKHSAVRAALHRDFVNPGRVPEGCGDTFDSLFEDRQQGDYQPNTKFELDDLRRLHAEARTLINCFRELCIDSSSTTHPKTSPPP